jgi:hypothetical protein
MMSLPLMANGLPLAVNPKACPLWVAVVISLQDYPAVEELAVEQDSLLVSVNPSRTAAIGATTFFATSD